MPEPQSATSADLTFPPKLRIRRSEDFQHIYQQRNRISDAFLLVYAARNEFDYSRIGLSISRKQGNAVRRNRWKRLLREAFRLQQHYLPRGFDWILIPQKRDSEPTLAELKNSLSQLTRRLAKRREK